jgi:Leucine-rich repeat (LRR) protein
MVEGLSKIVELLPNLEELDLIENSLCVTEKSVSALKSLFIAIMERKERLKILRLRGFGFPDVALEDLCKMLLALENLEVLDVRLNGLSARGLEELYSSLAKRRRKLKELHFDTLRVVEDVRNKLKERFAGVSEEISVDEFSDLS